MPPEHLRARQPMYASQMEEYDEADNDDLAQAETYAEYSPRRCKLPELLQQLLTCTSIFTCDCALLF